MRTLVHLIGICALLAAGGTGAAELYKWVDENGITNYSNESPPRGAKATPLNTDDRISVYSPDPAVLEAIEAQRNRRTAPPPVVAAPPVPPPGSAPPPPPARTQALPQDPCLSGNDPRCSAVTIYDSSPIFVGRQRTPVPVVVVPPPPPPKPPPVYNMPRRATPSTGREFSPQ